MPAGHLTHQRQADPAALGLGGPAPLEHPFGGRVVESRAAVAHHHVQGTALVVELEHDAARIAVSHGVEGVVEQVADHGEQVASRQADGLRDRPRDGQLDAALGGLGALAEQQGREHRVAHRVHHLVGEPLGQRQLLGGEGDGVVRAAHLHQRDHRVQPVRGLVGLRAQGVGEPAHDVELAGDRLQLGVVAQAHHGTHLVARPARGR